MTRPIFRSAALIGFAAAAALASPAFANHPTQDPWLGTAVHGDTVELPRYRVLPDRIIQIDPSTRWVTVKQNETIKFIVRSATGKEESFVWRFDGGRNYIDLSQLAPGGLVSRPIPAYVWPDPRDQ